jgi:putative endonuclease
LRSEKDNQFYVGYTADIRRRLEEHNKGMVTSTKNRTPFVLVYWEGCLNQKDATTREKYLKTAWGKRYIKNRLKNYLTG